MSPPVWFVSGASRGLGRAIANAALDAGRIVVGTFRDSAAADGFTAATADRTLGVRMDARDGPSIDAAVAAAVARFGAVDVLVNNAGGGLFGAIEEVASDDFRALVETNLIGASRLVQAVLPHMRTRRSGTIFQMSSVSGFAGMPGLGHYAATKFGLEGLSEALALEVAPLGIRVAIVEPGPFRTAWIDNALTDEPLRISDYRETAHAQIDRLAVLSGNQPGDPAKAARLLVDLSTAERLPLRIPLGRIAIARVREKIARLHDELAWIEDVAAATDY